MENEKYYAGIDLGGTFIKGCILTKDGSVIIKDKIKTTLATIAEDIANFVRSLENRAGVKVESIGVGTPGIVDSKRGVVVLAKNVGFKNEKLREKIQKHINLPIYITNDANAAALGEYFVGAGKKYKNLILVTLGTGVGGGIILDGKLFEGHKSAGAEIGHITLRVRGEKCTCGRRGCFEAYSSATALIRDTKKAMLKDKESALWKLCDGNIDNVNGKTAFDGFELGDKTAVKVVRRYIKYLAEGITDLANIFRPEVILLGGGISGSKDILLKPLNRILRKEIFAGSRYAPVKLDIASLGNDAGMIGAGKLSMP